MSGVSFNRAEISSGVVTVIPGQSSPRVVSFEKKMDGIPTVTVTPIDANQNVIAANVTSTGFNLIISIDGISEPVSSFKVHYQAIFLR